MTAPKPITDRKVLAEKIEKLAAMTIENGANENEAANAAAAMQAILQRYNLSMAELAGDIAAIKDPMATTTVKMSSRDNQVTKRGQPWKRKLAYGIGRAFFVETLTSPMTATFLGAKTDVETAEYAFNFLVNVLDPMARSYTADFTDTKIAELGLPHKGHLTGENHPNVVRNSWLDGAVSTVTLALNKQSEKFENESKKANALVIARHEAATQYAQEKYPHVFGMIKKEDGSLEKKKGKQPKGWAGSNQDTNWAAYKDGKVAGENIKVSKGVKAPKQTAKAIAATA